MFIEMMTSNSSSTLATKSSTVRLSHSRSWAKRVASVTATPFLLNGAIISRTVAEVCWRSGMAVPLMLGPALSNAMGRQWGAHPAEAGGDVRGGWKADANRFGGAWFPTAAL